MKFHLFEKVIIGQLELFNEFRLFCKFKVIDSLVFETDAGLAIECNSDGRLFNWPFLENGFPGSLLDSQLNSLLD